MNNKYSVLVILLICTLSFSCKQKSDIEKIQDYYLVHKPDGKFEKYRKIIIINELGNCINCNNRFSLQMSYSINNQSILFIVSGMGSKVDISPYINILQENIIWDTKSEFDQLKITKACAIIDIDIGRNTKITEILPENVCESGK